MSTLDKLVHTEKTTSRGAKVFVLDTGAVIDPEAEAMIQALHSRSTGGLKAHLETLAKKGAKKFMENFYVGYGHKSIGDCGSVTVFVEGVSMLAAKAIQDWPLYSGQEASTRYIDFSNQPFMGPIESDEGAEIQEKWREFYLRLQEPIRRHLESQFPRQPEEKEEIWAKAIKARAFDITRAFLPAGATTNLAWHTNLRQASDALALLRHHPLKEIAELGEVIEAALREKFPSSFSHKRYQATEEYNGFWMRGKKYYHDPEGPDFSLSRCTIEALDLGQYDLVLLNRPPKTELPRDLGELGQIQFSFTLDFGSFRDIQRHRGVIQRMPLLTEEIGFHPWYIEQLPESFREEARRILAEQSLRTDVLGVSREERQYYIPMGYLTSCLVTGGLPQVVYLVELRATRFVHPTLQMRASQMAQALQEKFGEFGLTLHLDNEPGRFDVRRGEHDIVERK